MSEQEKLDKASLYAKMARVMSHMERLPKRGYNAFHKYEYVLDADVLEAVRNAMAKEKVAFFHTAIDVEQRGVHTLGTYQVTFADGETGQTITAVWTGEANDKGDKGINKALTAAIKYGLLKTFLISTGEDDPDESGGEKARKKPSKAKKSPKAPPKEIPVPPQNETDGVPGSKMFPVSKPKPAQHWADLVVRGTKQTLYERLLEWADSKGGDEVVVLAGLNVSDIHDYTGSPENAKEAVETWMEAGKSLPSVDADPPDTPF